MDKSTVNFSSVALPKNAVFRTRAKAVAALAVLAVSLAGCVVYPDGGYGGGPGYYAPPVVGSVVVGGGWGGGWRGGWGRWR